MTRAELDAIRERLDQFDWTCLQKDVETMDADARALLAELARIRDALGELEPSLSDAADYLPGWTRSRFMMLSKVFGWDTAGDALNTAFIEMVKVKGIGRRTVREIRRAADHVRWSDVAAILEGK